MGIDRDRDADRTLNWSAIDTTLQALEGKTLTLLTEWPGKSRVSVTGQLRLVDLPFARCLGFAVARAVVTLYEDDLAQARLRTLGDGHFFIRFQLGNCALVIGDSDLLAVDYEDVPFPDDPATP